MLGEGEGGEGPDEEELDEEEPDEEELDEEEPDEEEPDDEEERNGEDDDDQEMNAVLSSVVNECERLRKRKRNNSVGMIPISKRHSHT